MPDINSNVSIDFSKKNNAKTETSGTTSKVAVKATTTKSAEKPATKGTSRGIAKTSATDKKPTSHSRSPRWTRGGTGRWRRPGSTVMHCEINNVQVDLNNFVLPTEEPTGKIKKGEKPVRVGSLMGLTQVGQCMFVEYENDMIIIDAGMEFSAYDTLGADYIIPDISYVKKNIKKLRGIVISHGHLDHVGALRDMLPELGFPTIYTTPLTLGIIKKTFDDSKLAEKIKYKIVDPNIDIVKLGCFTIEFAYVNHNIPETLCMSIHTPKGIIFNSSDFKIDHTPAIGQTADLPKFARFGSEGVKLYIGDSLGSDKPGWAKSEREIWATLDSTIRDAQGRVFVATFASNVGRVIQLINSAIKYNRVVFITGRSMLNNVEICQQLGYIKVPKGTIRRLNGNEINDFPDERVLVLSTGAQGEEFAALTRMARNEHSDVTLRPTDTVLISASVIPGNEYQMDVMLNNLAMKELSLKLSKDIDIHTSGHGYAEDHKLMLALIRPEFFLPFYLTARFRYAHRQLALDMGMHSERILMPHENGAIIEMYDDIVRVSPKPLKLRTVLVDGKGKGHMSGEYVIKARKIMAHDGMISLVFKVDTQSKDLVGNIQIESRGFVYSSEVKNIHTKIVELARKKYNQYKKNKRNTVRDILRRVKDDLGVNVNKMIGREPMIVPMFVYINRDAMKQDVDQEEAIVGMTLEEQGSEE